MCVVFLTLLVADFFLCFKMTRYFWSASDQGMLFLILASEHLRMMLTVYHSLLKFSVGNRLVRHCRGARVSFRQLLGKQTLCVQLSGPSL